MPTLKQYEARGIDITKMTSEQLIAEGYVTPWNELPVIIDVPGEYKTRSGKRVTIWAVKPTTTLATTAYNANGSIWTTPTKMRPKDKWALWHVSGKFLSNKDEPLDIVAKWEGS